MKETIAAGQPSAGTTPHSWTGNAHDEASYRRQVAASLDRIAAVVGSTMGPYGSTTLVQDRNLQHYFTKDGYTVLKNLFYLEDVPRTVLDVVKRVSRRLVSTVGDGSTSAAVAAAALFKSLSDLSSGSAGATPRGTMEALDALGVIIRARLDAWSRPAGADELALVARVSADEDPAAAKLALDVFSRVGRHGAVLVREGLTLNDRVEYSSGMKLGRGYVDQRFARSEDGNCELEDAFVFMCDEVLTASDLPAVVPLVQATSGAGRPLVIVAAGYDPQWREFFKANVVPGPSHLPLVAVDVPVHTKVAADKFADLAAYLGAVPYLKGRGHEAPEGGFPPACLGRCKLAVIDDKNSRFSGGAGDPSVLARRVAEVERALAECSEKNDAVDRTEEEAELRMRLAQLSAESATVYTGGAMDTERAARRFLVEDALYALASADAHGVLPGGNLSAAAILTVEGDEILEELYAAAGGSLPAMDELHRRAYLSRMMECVKDAFLSCYEKALLNSGMPTERAHAVAQQAASERKVYDIRSGAWEDWEYTRILCSAQTDAEIVRAAFAVAGQLLTSNQFLSVTPIVRQD